MQATHFCKQCRKPTTLKQHDFGVGVTEAYGRRENHVDIATVTTCCESEHYFDSEQDFADDLRVQLSKQLYDADTLSKEAVYAIEALLNPAKPKPLISTAQQHQGTTITNMEQLCRDILLAPFRGVVR